MTATEHRLYRHVRPISRAETSQAECNGQCQSSTTGVPMWCPAHEPVAYAIADATHRRTVTSKAER